MAKFSGSKNRPVIASRRSPATTGKDRALTPEGGVGYTPEVQTELFLTAATTFSGEETFYESATDRDARFVDLVHRVTAEDPDFVARLARYLRSDLLIRSAAVTMAAEYVAAGGPEGRAVVDSVLQRGDEPAEMIGYWISRHGRRLKMAVKRGVADAVRRLYTERAALRYDGQGRYVRMGDVLELVHPAPVDARQSTLFRWLLDRRHHGDAAADEHLLPTLAAAERLAAVPEDQRRKILREEGAAALAEAGFSWERLSGWLPGGMDAEAWEAVIPSMGVMALLRNLRNFDEQGISPRAVHAVVGRITDAREVKQSRIFPYQVWAAYANAPSDNWKRALGTTLDLTTGNVPALDGTLVVIDTSGSMEASVSNRSTMRRVDVAAVMAMVTAARSTNVDVVIFGERNAKVRLARGASVLAGVNHISGLVGSVGHATYGHTAIARHYNPKKHRRVVMFTDDQQHDAGAVALDHVPLIYTVDLAGYRPRSLPSGSRGRHTLAGFSDATFTIMSVLESGQDAHWPF